MTLSSSDANLVRPDGTPLTLFQTVNRLSGATGVELAVAVRVAGRLGAEVSGDWTRTNLESAISGDFEGAVAGDRQGRHRARDGRDVRRLAAVLVGFDRCVRPRRRRLAARPGVEQSLPRGWVGRERRHRHEILVETAAVRAVQAARPARGRPRLRPFERAFPSAPARRTSRRRYRPAPSSVFEYHHGHVTRFIRNAHVTPHRQGHR